MRLLDSRCLVARSSGALVPLAGGDGQSVAALCDELLRDARTHVQDRREALDRTVHEELGRQT